MKERYPTFVDALRDLDDGLCLISLFAGLTKVPSNHPKDKDMVERCSRLSREWMAYVARTHSLRKVFLTVKGVYYQAEVFGQTITWMAPYAYTQDVGKVKVDMAVMLTFTEFAVALQRFVHYKLYTGLNLVYPPPLDEAKDADAGFLDTLQMINLGTPAAAAAAKAIEAPVATKGAVGAVGAVGGGGGGVGGAVGGADSAAPAVDAAAAKRMSKRLKSLPEKLKQLSKKGGGGGDSDDDEDGDEDDDEDDDEDASSSASSSSASASSSGPGSEFEDGEEVRALRAVNRAQGVFEGLFADCVIFVSREVPRQVIEFTATSFGAQVGWEGPGSPFPESDPRITHQVVDRTTQSHRFLSRVYVQPQWVVDSANEGLLLPTKPYAPGASLPPHLSPFSTAETTAYVPAMRKTLDKLKAAVAAGAMDIDEDTEYVEGEAGEGEMDEAEADEQNVLTEAEREAEFAEELEREAAGVSYSASKADGSAKKPRKVAHKGPTEEEENEKLAVMTLNKKKKKAYEKIQGRREARAKKIRKFERRAEEAKTKK